MRWQFGVLPQLGEAIPLVTVRTDYDYKNAQDAVKMATYEPVEIGAPLKPTQVSPCDSCGIGNHCRAECIAFTVFAEYYKTGKAWRLEDVQRFPAIKHAVTKPKKVKSNPWKHRAKTIVKAKKRKASNPWKRDAGNKGLCYA